MEVEYVRSTTYGHIGRWAYRWVGVDMGGGSAMDGRQGQRAALTADAVDHEGVQLLLAMLALAGQVGHGLDLPVEQVVQKGQRHLLRRSAVGGDVEHVCSRDGTPHAHLQVVLVTQPGACWEVLWRKEREEPTDASFGVLVRGSRQYGKL